MPPPAHAAGATPSLSAPTSAGRVVGRVDGNVSVDLETRSLRGVQVFVTAGVLALAIAVIRGLGAFLTGLPGMVGALVPTALVLLMFLLIYGGLFGMSPARVLKGVGRGARSAAGAGARAAASGAAKGAAGGLRGGARASRSAGGMSTSVTVRRFRVRSMSGELVSCVQQGDLIGDEIRHGDYVLLDGRRTRDNHLVVNRVDVLQAPGGPTLSVVRTRNGGLHGYTLIADRVALVLGLLLMGWVVVEVVRMVR